MMSRAVLFVVLFIFIAIFSIFFFMVSSVFENHTVAATPDAPVNFAGNPAAAKMEIQNVGRDFIIIINTGETNIDTSNINIYADGRPKECIWNFHDVPPKTIGTCITDATCRIEIKALYGGSQATFQCPPIPSPPMFPS